MANKTKKKPKSGSDRSDKKEETPEKANPLKLEEKLKFAEVLKRTMGNISQACKILNVSRETYYEWKRKDPAFAHSCEVDTKQVTDDFVMSEFFKLVKNGNAKAILFYMERRIEGFGNKLSITEKVAESSSLSFGEKRDRVALLSVEQLEAVKEAKKILNVQD